MPQVNVKLSLLFAIGIVVIIFAVGCGDKNKAATFDPVSGTHESGWIGQHGAVFASDTTQCVECHGEFSDLDGGITGISCSGDSFGGTGCHGSGALHGASWTTDHALFGGDPFTSCNAVGCHGPTLNGPVVGCSECHLGGPDGTVHPPSWTNPFDDHQDYVEDTLGNDATSCSPGSSGVAVYCHGINLPPPPAGIIKPPNDSWDNTVVPWTCFFCHGKEWDTP